MKKFIFFILLIFLLLIFHEEAIIGTKQGLLLWYQLLIPSLLPFILVTNALAETNAYQAAAHYFQKYFPLRIYDIMAVLIGNLCGYPIGAKIVNDFVQNHYISSERGNRLLAFASQTNPMFLIGYIHLHILKPFLPLSVFLFSIYVPVLLLYFISSLSAKENTDCHINISLKHTCIKDTFLHAVQTMVIIGVYVIIFSILLVILFPFCKQILSKILLSFLEITTGVKLLNSLLLPTSLKIALIGSLSAFGGLCSAFQIKSVLNYKNAGIKKYLLDKIKLSAGTFLILFLYLT